MADNNIRSRLSPEAIAVLDQPFAPNDYKEYGKGMTSVKAASVIKRLHDAFGRGNIQISGDYEVITLEDFPVWKKPDDGSYGRVLDFTYTQHLLSFKGQIHITAGAKVTESFVFPIYGMRRLDDKTLAGQTFEEIKKSVRTNAISRGCFEHLLIAQDVYRGLVKIVGGVPKFQEQKSFEELQAEQAEAEAKREAAKSRAEITAWAKADATNKAKLDEIKEELGVGGKKLRSLDNDKLSELVARWKEVC